MKENNEMFLEAQTFLVAGASTKPEEFGNRVFNELLDDLRDRSSHELGHFDRSYMR